MTVCGIVLAAGGSARFGSPKQLAPLGGLPLLQHAIDSATAASLDRVIVVLGAHAAEVETAIDARGAEVVVCPDWASGVSASLKAGIAASGGADWLVVTLGDEPDLPPAAIDRIMESARAADPGVAAVRARWAGRPGHPVALRAGLAAGVHALEGDVGARALMAGVDVLEVDMDDLGASRDIDTPADLEAGR